MRMGNVRTSYNTNFAPYVECSGGDELKNRKPNYVVTEEGFISLDEMKNLPSQKFYWGYESKQKKKEK